MSIGNSVQLRKNSIHAFYHLHSIIRVDFNVCKFHE